MGNFLELFQFKKIRGKLFILTTLITFIPMMVLSLAFYQLFSERMLRNAEQQAFASGSIANHYLDRILVDMNDLFNVIISNGQIQCALTGAVNSVCQNGDGERGDSDYGYIRNSYMINNAMNTITQSKSYVVRYVVYHVEAPPNRRLYGSYISPEEAEAWYAELREGAPLLLRNGRSLDQNMAVNAGSLLFAKLLPRTSGDFSPLGFIVLEVNRDQFFKGLSFLNADRSGRFVIVDGGGKPLYYWPDNAGGEEENEELYELATKARLQDEGFMPIGDKWFAALQRNGLSGWSIVHMINADTLYKDAEWVRTMTLAVFILTFAMGLVLANWISGTIRRPLHRLLLFIKMNGAPGPRIPVPFDPEDEVGQIGVRFLRMMDENKALHQQVYNALKKRKEAEIHALQAQINPHFLYNTLESLKWMAFARGQSDISEVVGMLGKYFRLTINKGRQVITVREELDHVQTYFQVLDFRYPGRFDLFFHFEEDLTHYYVPKFILQPIVENAIYHGLKKKDGEGTIAISGRTEQGVLIFQVTDDGLGIAPDRLAAIMEALDQEETSLTFGLKNVHDRLKLRYGEPFGIRLASEEGLYTTVTLSLPAITEAEERYHESDRENFDR